MGNPIDAWSFSRYSTYAQCPFKFKLQNIDKVPFKAGPAMLRGRELHKAAEDYLVGKRDDIHPELESRRDVLEPLKLMNPVVEQKWGFTRKWQGTGYFTRAPSTKKTWLRASLDAGVDYGDGTFEAIDWKTGKKYDDNEEQMELFGMVVLARYPDIKQVTTRLSYIDLPAGPDSEKFDEVQRKDYRALVDKWEVKIKPMFEDEEFRPRVNFFCKWCDFSREKGGPCPAA